MKNDSAFIPLSKPAIGKEEKRAVLKALDSGWITLGPKTAEFEDLFKAFIGTKHAVGVSSWTGGMHVVLSSLGIGPGDEVIAPVFTFAATINPVIQVGAKPVLVDIDRDTFLIDVQKVEKAITKKTKAIIPVHYAGQAVDMDALKDIAKRYNLKIIEDAAHAVGTVYKGAQIGTHGDAVVYSFHPIKNMTTGDGGMIVTNDAELDTKARLYRLHGMNKEAWKRLDKSGNWYYEIVVPGFKYNMTDISASIGIEQLKKLSTFILHRTKIAALYTKAFVKIPEITSPKVLPYGVHAWNLYSVLLDVDALTISRNDFIEELKKRNIGTSVYFTPLHMHPYYQKALGYNEGDFPNSEWVYQRLLCLPMSNAITMREAKTVIHEVTQLISEYKKHG